MELPFFKYHPDPLATGSIVRSGAICEVCGAANGFVYEGGCYGEKDLDKVCPWCIASGTAHEKYGVEFTSMEDVGGRGEWNSVPLTVAEEVAYRTPGFSGWQQQRWFTHCSDAAEFLGPLGYLELSTFGTAAVDAIRVESGFQGERCDEYLASLHKDNGPTAYLFRCRHCGCFGGYSDVW